jgi:AraC-like DNA-binding protein
MHYHENSYLSLLINGAYSETNKQESRIINGGDIIFRPADYDHANQFNNKTGLCFNIEFKNDLPQSLDFKLALPSHKQHYQCGAFPQVYKAFIELLNGQDKDDISSYLIQWLFEVNNTKIPDSNIHWIGKVKHILTTETEVNHTINSIAERVFVHPVYLAGCFKKKTGLTIGQYQMKAKLEKALHSLFNSAEPISKISEDNGFFDAAHFIRRFTAVYGITPQQFRKNLK